MQDNMKMGLIDQFLIAVSNWKAYDRLSQLKTRTIVKYLLIFNLLLTVIIGVIPAAGQIISMGGFENFFTNGVPEFELKDGELNMEHRMVMDFGASIVLVDTDVDEFTKADLKSGYLQQVMMSKTNIYVSNMGQNFDVAFSDMPTVYVNNESLLKLVPYIYIGYIFMTVLIFIFTLSQYVFTALVYAVIGISIQLSRKIRLSFGQLFKLAVYAKTTAALIGAVNETLGYRIPSAAWGMISVVITVTYLSFGILSHSGMTDAKQEIK